MLWKRFLIILVPLLAGACNLSFSGAVTPTPPPPIIAPTSPPVVIIQPPGVQVTPEVGSNLPPNGNGVCSPRVGWPMYIVQAGDTLADIATASSSTVDELTTANCLDDPNAIFEGQVLHVPNAVIGNSAGVPPKVQGAPYQLLISPVASYGDGGTAGLQAGATVVLQWAQQSDEVPDHIEFDLTPTGTGAIPTIIGTATAADGWAMQWVVPAGLSANLSAVATMTDGTVRTTPLYLAYSST